MSQSQCAVPINCVHQSTVRKKEVSAAPPGAVRVDPGPGPGEVRPDPGPSDHGPAACSLSPRGFPTPPRARASVMPTSLGGAKNAVPQKARLEPYALFFVD